MNPSEVEALPLPPGPQKNVSLDFLLGKKSHLNVQKLYQDYGDVVAVTYKDSDGENYIVFVSGYENIYYTFVKRSVDFASRPTQYPNILMNPHKLGIADSVASPEWKKQRQFFMVALMKLGVGKQRFEDQVREEAEQLVASIQSAKRSPIKIEDYLALAAYNVVHFLLFGFRYDHEDKRYEEIMLAIEKMFNEAERAITSIFGNEKKLKKSCDKLLEYIREQINEHSNTLEADNPRDYLDLYILEMQKEGAAENGFTHAQLEMQVLDFFGAAIETITTTMQWAFLYLTNRPELQERLFEDVQSVVLDDSPIHMNDQQKLPYLCSTLLEIQRFASVAAMTPPHKSIETHGSVELLGFRIPHHAEIVGNIYSIHFNGTLFPEADVLKPDRFLDAEGNMTPNKHVMPFSIGARACVGMKIAKIEMFLFFAEMIRHFRFTAPGGKKLSEVGEINDVLTPKSFKLICTPRT